MSLQPNQAHASTDRRSFLKRVSLRSTAVSIALPLLPSAGKAFADKNAVTQSAGSTDTPTRMVCVGNEFGMYPDAFWPSSAKELSPLLAPLEDFRDDFTVFSHLDHGIKGGHFAVHTFLTGIDHSEARRNPEAGISLDQLAAENVGSQTRFPSLTVGSATGLHGGCRMSWTRTGTRVPPIRGPRELFEMLFVDGDDSSKAKLLNQIDLRGSILDTVLDDARSLSKRLNPGDRQKLDEYLSSIRDVEVQLDLDRTWQNVPKPDTTMDTPVNEGLTKDLPKIYDLIALALQTDSTRVATLEVGGSFAARDLGIKQGYHGLSHHGKVQANIDLLVQIELYQTQQFARFLKRLDSVQLENTDGSLLDHTMALFGSGMGNANSHTNHDLPVILAGGGFRHRTFAELPKDNNKRVPLSNLFVSMLQQFGVETDQFAGHRGTLRGLESI